jgi:DNA-binding transcriptional LysR family regulator
VARLAQLARIERPARPETRRLAAVPHLDQVVQAAVGGQGVALGRLPMIAEHLRDGRLVAPFARKYDSARGYFALAAPRVAERDDVAAFLRWLADEAALEAARAATPRPARASAATRTRKRRVGRAAESR